MKLNISKLEQLQVKSTQQQLVADVANEFALTFKKIYMAIVTGLDLDVFAGKIMKLTLYFGVLRISSS